MRYLGIDPGKTGGIAIIDTEDMVATDKLKVYDIPRIGLEVDVKGFRDLLVELTRGDHHLCMEEVHTVFGSSAKSNFNFGQVVGLTKGLLLALNIQHSFVQPKAWQKEVWRSGQVVKKADGGNDTKAESLLAAQRWFPNTKFLKSKDGRVDAALIALYGKIKYGK